MSKQSGAFFLLFVLFSFVRLISSTPVRSWPVQNLGQRAFLGYNGFNGVPRPPQVSAGGELGAVFYIADAVDLARLFSNGADPNRNYICLVTADATEWSRQPKVWVPQRIIAQGGAAVDRNFVGAVLFAPHAHPGFPGAPANVYQMGVRQAQIARLQLQTDCRPKAYFANDHSTLNYRSLIGPWAIQTPALSFSGMEVWLKGWTLPWY